MALTLWFVGTVRHKLQPDLFDNYRRKHFHTFLFAEGFRLLCKLFNEQTRVYKAVCVVVYLLHSRYQHANRFVVAVAIGSTFEWLAWGVCSSEQAGLCYNQIFKWEN